MASPITDGSPAATAMFALTALEEQLLFVAQQLIAAQSLYNEANPTAPKIAVEMTPNFTGNTISINAVLPLESTAATSFAPSSVKTVF